MPHLPAAIAAAYFAVFALALLWVAVTTVIASIFAAFRARQFPNETSSPEAEVVITLVHGTWARRATWTVPGSPLCRTLSRATDASICVSTVCLDWSELDLGTAPRGKGSN